jgi:hypothetical protein
MNRDLNKPWIFDRDDLDPTDPNYKISRPYRIWHEYLKISPSFALAVKEHEYRIDNLSCTDKKRRSEGLERILELEREILLKRERLTLEENNQKPDDYKDVVKTYNGMAYGGWEFSAFTFKRWWLTHGADIFGHRHDPQPTSLLNVPHHAELDETEFKKSLETYLSDQRLYEGMPGFSIVAIPLNGDKKKIITSLNRLINEQPFEPIKKMGEPLFQLQKGKQLSKLSTGLRLLWLKALYPKLELWKLGLLAEVTLHKRYKILDPSITKHTDETKMLSENLATMTSHRLKESLIYMENAARGRFPCADESLLPAFNQKEILALVEERIRKIIKREDNIEKIFSRMDGH